MIVQAVLIVNKHKTRQGSQSQGAPPLFTANFKFATAKCLTLIVSLDKMVI